MKFPDGRTVAFVMCLVAVGAFLLGYNVRATTPTTGYYLQGPSASAYAPSYSIGQFTNGSYFMVNGSTLHTDYVSTNASAVFINVVGNMTSGGTVFVKAGTYNIAYVITIAYDNIYFEGEGKSTKLSFTASGAKFYYSKASNLDGGGFNNMYFEGNTVCINAIDSSGMPTACRIRELKFTNLRIWNFVGAALKLKNYELNTISDCDFHHNGGDLYLYDDGYFAGNIFVSHNFFGAVNDGDYAIYILSATTDYGSGSLYSSDNHYYADSSNQPDVESIFVNASAANVMQIHSIGDRTENCGLFNGTATLPFCILDVIIDDDQFTMGTGSPVGVTFPLYTRGGQVKNCYFAPNTGQTAILDLATSIYFSDEICNNQFTLYNSGSMINGSDTTYVHDNVVAIGSTNPPYINYPIGLKQTDNRNGYQITYYGSNDFGFNGTGLNYTVQTCDIFLNVSGGTVSNITIYDPYGNVWITNITSLNNQLIPWHYIFSITFSVAPTYRLIFKG